jgi:hypothetical protein
VREAARLGFTTALVPAAQASECEGFGVNVIGVPDVKSALEAGLAPRAAAAPEPAGADA